MTTESEIVDLMTKVVEKQEERFSSSYHGLNCRTCNRNPSIFRKLRWRIEDAIWRLMESYHREKKILYTCDDYLL